MCTVYNVSMYELYPYFTNDGSVGLFSRQDDDIYHSTYGALTESWQKFILPAHLKEYLAAHDKVKILDICYGIGYNTKVALNVFIKNILETKKNSKTHAVETIHTDNVSNKKNRKRNKNIERLPSHDYSAIDTDNVKVGFECSKLTLDNLTCNNILIDAVDSDNVLTNLSPFIKDASKFNFLFKNDCEIPVENKLKYKQINSIKNYKKFIKKEFKLKKEVPIILLEKLFEKEPEFLNDVILQSILKDKKYTPFLNNYTINLAEFYLNRRYKQDIKGILLTFLHNIYYQYVSTSYKKAQKLLENSDFDINFHNVDVREFIKSTNNIYNFIFLDAFTPAKCPALWTVQFFGELYSKLDDDGMILTYSNSAAVRNAFLKNGFAVGKIYDPDLQKFVGTIAAKNKMLIENELDMFDLNLINSKAGICYSDENLNLDNDTIIEKRKSKLGKSKLISSSKVLKGHKNEHIESL